MDDAFNESVVTERKESLTFGISSVPTAQRRRLFVGEEDKVLRMVEHRLSPMMLRSSSACVKGRKRLFKKFFHGEIAIGYLYPGQIK